MKNGEVITHQGVMKDFVDELSLDYAWKSRESKKKAEYQARSIKMLSYRIVSSISNRKYFVKK